MSEWGSNASGGPAAPLAAAIGSLDDAACAVDIGGTKLAVGLVNRRGQLLASRRSPTRGFSTGSEAVLGIKAMLFECEQTAGVRARGLGIGCTGPVDHVAGEIGKVDLLPGWQGYSLVSELQKATGLPAALENDADAGALAEWRWGAGRGSSRFVYVSVGTGIGSGIVFDGVLYRGAAGLHPEFGHHTIDTAGPQCYCGATGCWEVLASGPALEAWFAQQSDGSQMLGDALSAVDIVSRARDGNPDALRAIEREARYLGIGLANIATAFVPDRIALAGGLMAAWDLFSQKAIAAAHERCGLIPFEAISVARAELGDEAPLLGAAQVFFQTNPLSKD